MANLTIPYAFSNNTTANASEVNQNFAAVKTFVESQAVQVDGSVKATLASLANEIVNKLVPTGTIVAYAGAAAPTGWLLCDGSAIPGGNPVLVSIVGANTPNLKGRALVGRDATAAPFNGALLSTLGSTTSVASHQHSISGTADSAGGHAHNWSTTSTGAHAHSFTLDVLNSVTSHGHGGDSGRAMAGSGTGDINASTQTDTTQSLHSHSGATDEQGAHGHSLTLSSGAVGDAHGNVQPSTLVNYIIKHD